MSPGVKLADETELTPAQCTAWVAGVTAGTNQPEQYGRKYVGAVDIVPRMTKTEMGTAIQNGNLSSADTAQNVTAVYDINSLTTVTTTRQGIYKEQGNQAIDGINNDITTIFESNFVEQD